MNNPQSTPIETLEKYSGKIDGYRGIWFDLGPRTSSEYGSRYSGGLGTYTVCHQPVAVYCPEVDKTFFTYGGTPNADSTHLLIMASYYDHSNDSMPKPTIVCDKQGVDDPHDNGSIRVDKDGYVWVVVSGRNTTRWGFVYRSLEPWSVEEFELVGTQEITYPQVWYHPTEGFCMLFTKYYKGPEGLARELYWKTSPDGREWSEDGKLAGFSGHYQVSGQQGDKIATFFNWHPKSENNDRTNIYYAETSDMGKTWTTFDGKPLSLPLDSPDNDALVIDYYTQGKRVYPCDINFDEDGNPVLLYVRSNHGNPGPGGDPREWCVSRWTGTEWETNVVTISTHNYDMGSLYIEADEWRIIGPTDAGPQPISTGGEVALWVSQDKGHTWTKRQQITSDSPYNHSHVRRPLNAKDPFYAFWADGHTDKMTESRLFFCDSTGKQVRKLPYHMDTSTAHSEKIDQ